MASRQMVNVVGVLRGLAGTVRTPEQLPDNQLLERFALQNDEAAFTTLVQKYGSMVWGVCHRVLGNGADADDAFQATFMVLVRRASEVSGYQSLSGWLHNVACRVALKARCTLARQHKAEHAPMEEQSSWPEEDPVASNELHQMLDEELQCLPDKWRLPLVLCYLQGKTHEEAARDLGLARGSMARRISRAQEKLRARLARRGVVATASVLGLCLAELAGVAAAPVPPSLVLACRQAVLAFLRGELTAASNPAVALAQAILTSGRISLIQKCMLVALGIGLAGGAGWVAASGTTVSPGEPPALSRQAPVSAGPVHSVPAVPGPGLRPEAIEAIARAKDKYAAVQQAARNTMNKARGKGSIVQGLDQHPEIRNPLRAAELCLQQGDAAPAGSPVQTEHYRQAIVLARDALARADAAANVRYSFSNSQRSAVMGKIGLVSGLLDDLEQIAVRTGVADAVRKDLASARASLRQARAGLKKGDRFPKKSASRQDEYEQAHTLVQDAEIIAAGIQAKLKDMTR